MVYDEIWCDSEGSQCVKHYRRPTIMNLTGSRICCRVVRVVRVRVLAGDYYCSHFNRWVDRLHRILVVAKRKCIAVRILRSTAEVILPASVVLIAYFPVMKSIASRNVRIEHPIRRLLRRAAAIIDRNKRIGVYPLHHVCKCVEAGSPLPGVVPGGVCAPVIFVGERSSGETRDSSSVCGEERDGRTGIELRIPNCCGN